jgi:hypothetical protein
MAGRPTRRRGKNRGPETLGVLLSRASPDDESRRAAPLPPRAWYDAVGDRVARRTRPIRLERNVLTVRAATAVWAQELSFLAPTIIKKLAALGCPIESLRFVVGPVEAPSRAAKPLPIKKIPLARPLPKDLSATISRVDDPDLRRTIARAATANLAWQELTGTIHTTRIDARTSRVTSMRPDARAPRDAAPKSDPPAQKPTTTREASRRKPEGR